MSKTKTYKISLPLSKKDYEFLMEFIDSPEVEISENIRNAFYEYKEKNYRSANKEVFNQTDYSKFINKLKEKHFIEQFEKSDINFSVDRFYKKLEKLLQKNRILFDSNYVAPIEHIRLLEKRVTEILKSYFSDESPRLLICAYIIGRALFSGNDVNTDQKRDPFENVPLSKEATRIARIHKLSLDKAKKIDVVLDYSDTTATFLPKEILSKFRQLILDYNIIKSEPVYKIVDKIYEIIPNNDIGLLNMDWNSIVNNELNFIYNKAMMISQPLNGYLFCSSFKGCCDTCSKDIVGKVFKVSEAPRIPYEKCNAEICLCYLTPINPENQFISKDGHLKLKIENEKEWQYWYKNIFKKLKAT